MLEFLCEYSSFLQPALNLYLLLIYFWDEFSKSPTSKKLEDLEVHNIIVNISHTSIFLVDQICSYLQSSIHSNSERLKFITQNLVMSIFHPLHLHFLSSFPNFCLPFKTNIKDAKQNPTSSQHLCHHHHY